jgi:hypothetical protein
MHLLNAYLAELSESSVILVLFELIAEFLLNASLCICSMPTWQSFYRTPQRFCLQLCSSPQPCLLRCSTTSKVFSRVDDFNFCAHLARLCLTPQSSEMHPLCTAIRTRSVLSHPPGVKPQRPLKLEIKQNPCKCLNITYIHSIKEHSQTFI